jgi:hypothetical protein
MRSLLFKNHALKSEALKVSDNLRKEAMKMLDKVANGELRLQNLEGTGKNIGVGRGGDKLFDTLRDYAEVDWSNELDTESNFNPAHPPPEL